MLDDDFKKSATEKITAMSANEYKKAFKDIGSEPKTNEEWFCGLSTEEKAKFLREMVYYGCLYDEWEQQSITENVPTEVIIVEWLKQPHREE